MKDIYLDNNATTEIDEEVFNAMLPYLKSEFGNPSSLYSLGTKVKEKINESRRYVADLIGSNTMEIIFTSCASESNVTAIMSAIRSNEKKRHIITTKVEHASVIETMKYLETRGYDITYLSVDEHGRMDLEELKNSIRDDTVLISVMMANNEIGNIYPVEKIGEIANRHNILFHVDAVQAVGKIDIDVSKIKCDTLSISAHKIHGPKGIGVLYVRDGILYTPLIFGHQENNRRGGTENVAYIVGLGVAVKRLKENMQSSTEQMVKLRDKLENEIKNNLDEVLIYGDINRRMPNTTSVAFKDVDANELMFLLESFNIYVSTGSACNSREAEPSHVLRAMNADLDNYSPIRISLSEYTTEEEVDEFVRKIVNAVTMLRRKNK
ncbi:MAG: cysteine desulfurase family protein [Bacilli bacterium]|nr:cysteine desulfurase family protein [Bacilli bacterium]